MMFLVADRYHSYKNYRSTGLGIGPILRVVYKSELTHFKLIVDFGLEGFKAEDWEFERNVQINIPVAKLIFESSLRDKRLNIR